MWIIQMQGMVLTGPFLLCVEFIHVLKDIQMQYIQQNYAVSQPTISILLQGFILLSFACD